MERPINYKVEKILLKSVKLNWYKLNIPLYVYISICNTIVVTVT